MVTAVVERRREIGLRRVVGATRRQVMRQLLAEAVTLGILGGALGLVGMRERVTANGGQLLIQALPAGGTEVQAIFKAVEEV